MLESGQLIADRYRLDSPIGEGAMAAVWCAEDMVLKRQVAIKLLYVKGTRDPQAMLDQFLREARIAASVQHRNVIQTVDFGTIDEQQPFMVMELLSGESMGDRMERQPPLSPEQVIHLASLTLRGLAAVHDAGIVHRDLKPHNIFLQRDTDSVFPKILDFGISRTLEAGDERPSAIATQEGLIVGTPDYMAPEQARGEADIDKRADIYAMGVIIYQGLTQRLPFIAENIGDLIVKIVTQTPPKMHELDPNIHPSLSEMVAQAMARDKANRFSDARAMRHALLASAEQAFKRPRVSTVSERPPGLGADAAGRVSITGSLPPPVPGSPAAADAGGGGSWGDLAGLGQKSAAPPKPSAPAPPMPQASRTSAAPRSGGAAPTRPARVPGGSRGGSRKPSAPAPETVDMDALMGGLGGPSLGASDPFDPLGGGGSQAALDLDVGRINSQVAATDRDAPRGSRSSAARVRRRPAPKKRNLLLPLGVVLVALAAAPFVWFAMGEGLPTSRSDAAQDAPLFSRPPAMQRRDHPSQFPAHMRDVRFE